MERILEMNYRKAPLSKYEKSTITRKIKKMNLDDGDHTITIDVGKSFRHEIQLEVNVFDYDEFKKDGITYKWAKMVTLTTAKYNSYETSVGTTIPEREVL